MTESIVFFTKWVVAIVAIPAVVFGVMIGSRWWKDTNRSIKISALGFSLSLGEHKEVKDAD